MSPDVSPVKETISSDGSMAFEEALDKAAESFNPTPSNAEQKDNDDSISSEEVFVTSPAKKRAKLEAEVEIKDEEIKAEEDANVTMTMIAESTTTTLQAGGETITSTTVKLERAVTPPLSPPAPTVPSTPMSASSVLPMNIISPRTPQTPRSGRIYPSQQYPEDNEETAPDNESSERVHQRLIQQVGIFDKITIWNPDMELDKGDDCYVKSLTEWTKLANLVSPLSSCRAFDDYGLLAWQVAQAEFFLCFCLLLDSLLKSLLRALRKAFLQPLFVGLGIVRPMSSIHSIRVVDRLGYLQYLFISSTCICLATYEQSILR